ncbi:MAG: sialate O-acetylesterase [Chthoniobacterales bacterium]
MKFPFTLLVFLLAFAFNAHAELKLPAFFSDHMVLQAGVKTPIWGTAGPNEKVTITIDGGSVSATADAKGQWRVELPPQADGHNTDVTIAAPDTQKIIRDVLWGEVWFCSGQSNMVYFLELTDNSDAAIAAAQDPKLRMFIVKAQSNHEPQGDLLGEWKLTTPANAARFSAVAYYFGKKLRETTGYPIGMIVAASNGSAIASWIEPKILAADPVTNEELIAWGKYTQTLPAQDAKYKTDLQTWEAAAKTAKAAGQPAPPHPKPPRSVDFESGSGNIFNAMVHPFLGYAIRGFLWYQGESDATGNGISPVEGERSVILGWSARSEEYYAKAFSALITSWRHDWGNDQLPFYFVQLPNYADEECEHWPEMREIQRKTLTVPKTGMAITIDVGDANNLHPKNKHPIGERLARIALVNDYGQKIESTGPMIRTAKFEFGKTHLTFDHARSLKTTDKQPPRTFEVADTNGVFKPATATIEGNDIALVCAEVPSPKVVRYAWEPSPSVNLVNGDGLPAAPFKLDVR